MTDTTNNPDNNSVNNPEKKPGRKTTEPPPGTKTAPENDQKPSAQTDEINGRKGPDPTRYGDWEKNGRCIDF
ncbi:MAG: DUF1674 domain-containing protein [Gammaproteobacteria bacterium]|nr:DUF1674 domain-containing protein [Gammaproteobacteria bacterium]